MAQFRQSFAVLRKSCLRFVTETHQRLFATLLGPAKKNIINFRRRHGPRIGIRWIFPERAVAAPVSTEIRYRKKNFSGICDASPFELVTQISCSL